MPDSLDSQNFPPDYRALRESALIFELADHRFFELTGEDRTSWLQGQVTQDLRILGSERPVSFCLCSSTGQLEAVCKAWALPDRILISCEMADGDALLRRVETMVILEEVFIQEVTRTFRVMTLQGPESERQAREWVSRSGEAVLLLASDRTGFGGWDLWIPRSTFLESWESWSLPRPLAGAEIWDLARIEAGVPKSGIDYSERTLPPELGPNFESRHISYTKGCYTGQEVLMRIHSRGHTNRKWVALLIPRRLDPGLELFGESGDRIGIVTSSAWSPQFGEICAAMVRNEYGVPGSISVIMRDGTPYSVEVRDFPLV